MRAWAKVKLLIEEKFIVDIWKSCLDKILFFNLVCYVLKLLSYWNAFIFLSEGFRKQKRSRSLEHLESLQKNEKHAPNLSPGLALRGLFAIINSCFLFLCWSETAESLAYRMSLYIRISTDQIRPVFMLVGSSSYTVPLVTHIYCFPWSTLHLR